MRKRSTIRRPVSVRPSVRPSVCLFATLVCYVETYKDVIKHFYRPGSSIILVFELKHRYTIARETFLYGGVKYGLGEKKLAIFGQYLTLRNDTAQVPGCYGTFIGSHQ